MFAFSRLFKDPPRGSCDLQAKGQDQQDRAAASEKSAVQAVDAANKHLQSALNDSSSQLDAHAAYIQALLNLLSLQLRQSEKAIALAQPDSKSCGAVADTRAKLEDALTAAWQVLDWQSTDRAAGTTSSASFQALYEHPSILGAMQFCRYFTSNAGLTLLHKAVGADKLQPQQHQHLPDDSSSNTQLHQNHSGQQPPLRPFTLVVDSKGTGHVSTLQAALDMAAAAAGQRAQQHYSTSSSSSSMADQQPTHAADSGNATCTRRSSIGQRPVAANSCSIDDVDVQGGSEDVRSTCSSAAACDNLLIVLLPGTYSGSHALPGNIRHITIAGIPGSKTLLCEAGSDQPCITDTSPSSTSKGFVQQQQQQQQQQALQELDARMLRLQLAQRQAAAAAAPGQLLRCSSTSTAQQQQQRSPPACLLSCPFGVESLKLQHLHFELAGASGASGAAPQCQRVLMRQESAPASIGAAPSNGSSSSRFGRKSGRNPGASSKGRAGCTAEKAAEGEDEPYCIRVCAGSELRMEWCEFSGGAGGVLSEAGAMVGAMQCSFHQ